VSCRIGEAHDYRVGDIRLRRRIAVPLVGEEERNAASDPDGVMVVSPEEGNGARRALRLPSFIGVRLGEAIAIPLSHLDSERCSELR